MSIPLGHALGLTGSKSEFEALYGVVVVVGHPPDDRAIDIVQRDTCCSQLILRTMKLISYGQPHNLTNSCMLMPLEKVTGMEIRYASQFGIIQRIICTACFPDVTELWESPNKFWTMSLITIIQK